MRLPSKVTPYSESILAVFPLVLSYLKEKEMSPGTLYKKINNKIEDVGEFVDILDCLFALNKIDFDYERGVIIYVD